MAVLDHQWGTATDITPSAMQSLASSATAGVLTSAIDLSTGNVAEVLVQVRVDMPASGTPANDKAVLVFAAASIDGGTDYDDDATGAAGAYTPSSERNLRPVGWVDCPVSADVHVATFNLSPAFGGVLPQFVKLFIRNYTGLTLDSAGNKVEYQTVTQTVA